MIAIQRSQAERDSVEGAGAARRENAGVDGGGAAAERISRDEIKEFLDMRCIGACEASYRLFGFAMHSQLPAVMKLPIHLENQQPVMFRNDDDAVVIAEAENEPIT